MKKWGLLLGFFAVLLPTLVHAGRLEVLSKIYFIDKKYKSMEGPSSSQWVILEENKPSQLVWITGFRTEIVGADGKTPESSEFMCHINLDADIAKHAKIFGWNKVANARFFTLSQAQFEVDFPDGFGLPVLSDERFSLVTQVLNHNFENANHHVRHKVTIDYVLDKDLKAPMKPLFASNAFTMRLLEGKDGHFGISNPDESVHGPSCNPGMNAPAAGGVTYDDAFGKKFSGHWVVPPGREVNHTNVTKIMSVPFDTRVHYINIHLHPFAESLELKDLTTGKTVFKTKVKGPKGRIGLTHMNVFSSKKGVPIYKNHEYDLISIYNNTSGVNQDAMATMFIYLEDKEFKKPDIQAMTAPNVGPAAKLTGKEPHLLLKTTAGDLLAVLYPAVAPQTVRQMEHMVEAGIYKDMPFYRLEKDFVLQTVHAGGKEVPLTDYQKEFVQKIPAEFSHTPHVRGILSMAREDNDFHSSESSFSIVLSTASHLDQKYTVFGKIVRGWNVLTRLESAPRDAQNKPLVPLRILSAEFIKNPQKAKARKLAGPKALPPTQ